MGDHVVSWDDCFGYSRLDKTFIKVLKKRLSRRAIIKVTKEYYIITSRKNDRCLKLDIVACIRRPHEDHDDMIDYIVWKVIYGA